MREGKSMRKRYVRLNIYLDDPEIRRRAKAAASARDLAADEKALRRRLEAAKAIDRLREKIGPIGVPVSSLVKDGRREWR